MVEFEQLLVRYAIIVGRSFSVLALTADWNVEGKIGLIKRSQKIGVIKRNQKILQTNKACIFHANTNICTLFLFSFQNRSSDCVELYWDSDK
jgi:hypothetical protein